MRLLAPALALLALWPAIAAAGGRPPSNFMLPPPTDEACAIALGAAVPRPSSPGSTAPLRLRLDHLLAHVTVTLHIPSDVAVTLKLMKLALAQTDDMERLDLASLAKVSGFLKDEVVETRDIIREILEEDGIVLPLRTRAGLEFIDGALDDALAARLPYARTAAVLRGADLVLEWYMRKRPPSTLRELRKAINAAERSITRQLPLAEEFPGDPERALLGTALRRRGRQARVDWPLLLDWLEERIERDFTPEEEPRRNGE